MNAVGGGGTEWLRPTHPLWLRQGERDLVLTGLTRLLPVVTDSVAANGQTDRLSLAFLSLFDFVRFGLHSIFRAGTTGYSTLVCAKRMANSLLSVICDL